MAERPCIIPVAASAALEWAAGRLHDLDLLLKAPLVAEAVFVVNLPNRAAWRETVRLAAIWRSRGAVFLIARTGTPAVAAHMLKFQGKAIFHEATDPPKDRYIVPPEGFGLWIDSFVRDAPGVE